MVASNRNLVAFFFFIVLFVESSCHVRASITVPSYTCGTTTDNTLHTTSYMLNVVTVEGYLAKLLYILNFFYHSARWI